MNVKMAMELAEDDDIVVKTVVANDDVASADKADRTKRRGVAGEIFMWKVGGANGKPNFTIEEGTMEFGIGHHGEPGIKVEKLGTAKEMAKEMTRLVIEDKPFKAGCEVAVLVSGLGATPVMEQYIFFG